jgi:hypothetical protein
VAPVTGDAVCPTRALFLTTDQPLNPAEIAWPGGVPPLVFYQVESTQRARHYHTMLVFNYYSASVTHLVTALGVPYIEAGRVKTSQRAVRRYMQLQSVRVITDTVGRREALGFVDYMRQGMGRAAIRLEAATLGNPAIIDRRRARTRAWYPAGYRPVPTTTAGLAHVWDGEIHRSLTPDRVGRTYNGQTFAVIPDGPSPRLHLPLTVGAYVLRG